MIDRWIAFDKEELKKLFLISEVKYWCKSGIIEENSFQKIKAEYVHNLFAPSIVIRVMLFVASIFGLSMLVGLFSSLLNNFINDWFMQARVTSIIGSTLLILYLEKNLISKQKHFRSGVLEASVMVGYGFLYFGLVGDYFDSILSYFLFGFCMSLFVAIRYLNVLALVISVLSLVATLFNLFDFMLSIAPFVVILVFVALYWLSTTYKNKVDQLIWKDHFIVFQVLALMIVYLGANYFVIRELSIELMHLTLGENEDIPLAYVFYLWTVLVPIAYLYWGIKTKSVLFIRVSLLTLALAVFTLKYYFSLGHPEISITIGGGLLIVISLLLMKYLKTPRSAFTRNQLLTNKWDNSDFTALIASQTLGGHQINASTDFQSGGGTSGGAGASGEF